MRYGTLNFGDVTAPDVAMFLFIEWIEHIYDVGTWL